MSLTDNFDSEYERAFELLQQGAFEEAEPILIAALEQVRAATGPLSEEVGWAAQNLAKLYEAKGDKARAIACWERVIAVIEAHVGPDHISIGERLEILGMLALDLERWRDAERALRRALALFTSEYGPDDHRTVGLGFNLGNAL
ncbi:MAG TPA: tetratricopeptide repeat protein, partial [Chthonomonadaceae bacterium]|nr:tetratricopeptide repeat protein [Chthonomonadaceae bacterium]